MSGSGRLPAEVLAPADTIKLAAGAGLVLGLWIPYLSLVTCIALIAYFLIAIGMHVRTRDYTLRLFVNATAMVILSAAPRTCADEANAD